MFNPVPIKLPPGMFRNGTNYEAMGRWYDGNLVRWENGRLKPMGGWQSQLAVGSTLTGVARGGIAWADNNAYRYIALGTASKLYIGTAGNYTDVTPTGLVAGRTDSIFGAGFGAGVFGNVVPGTPALSTATGGSLAAGTYYVVLTYNTPTGESAPSTEASIAVAASGNLTITAPGALGVAESYNVYVGTSSGGETKQASNVALTTNTTLSSLVAGSAVPTPWDTYGTQRPASAVGLELDAGTWSFDTYGQDLLGVLTSDNTIWQCDPTTGLVTKQSSSAPSAIAVMVTNESYVLALGAGGVGRQVAWPDITNPTTWTPAITNTAGGIPLNTGGRCMSGTRIGTQNVIWTNMDLHALVYIGTPGIYGTERIGEACGLVGPNAYGVVGNVGYWWSWGGFKTYNGIVQDLPCEVQDYIWRVIDWTQVAKIYCETNAQFNEVTWYFPSLTGNPAVVAECDSYVGYNWKYNIWYFGIKSALARSTWVDKGVWDYPIATDASGNVYEHEVGYLANGATRVGQVYATSGPVEINGGRNVSYVDLAIPDVEPNPNAVALTVMTQNAPAGPVSTLGPVQVQINGEGYFPLQFAGRQAAMKVASAQDEDWSWGTFRVNIKGRGSR